MTGHPNGLAFAVLLLWPLVSLALFRGLGPVRGLLASLIGGYLLLPPPPAAFEITGLPALDKNTIPTFTALAICLVLYRGQLQLWPRNVVARLLLVVSFAAPLLTVLTNSDPVFWGSFRLPGLRLREVVPLFFGHLALVGPFLLAHALIVTRDDLRELLWAITIGTLLYSIPMLIEVRLSPQLNTWIYGYFQHFFDQMVRAGGYRPIVFLYHGLWVALLVSMAVLSASALFRSSGFGRPKWTLAAVILWLIIVLILCKSMAALIYAVLFVPLILFTSARMQVRMAALIAVLVLSYPVFRGADLVPVDALVAYAERIAADRAASLQFRFDNEEVLLERAWERPLFGWGTWGRNHIYDASGRITTVTDGRWVVIIGAFGWAGYLAEFGLLALPIFLALFRKSAVLPPSVGGATLILAVNMADLIPNATLTPLTWLFAGSILSWAERPLAAKAASDPGDRVPPSGGCQTAVPRVPVVLGGGRKTATAQVPVILGGGCEADIPQVSANLGSDGTSAVPQVPVILGV